MQRALAVVALCFAFVTAATGVAAAFPPASSAPAGSQRIEDQNDRLLQHLRAQQAEPTVAAVALARSMERNLAPLAVADHGAAVALARSMERNLAPVATPVAVGPVPAVPREVDTLATLILGLIGGLAGGVVAIAGWTATTRRRLRRVAAA
jgi:hypothetical protein